jgi:hypothetical protein
MTCVQARFEYRNAAVARRHGTTGIAEIGR